MRTRMIGISQSKVNERCPSLGTQGKESFQVDPRLQVNALCMQELDQAIVQPGLLHQIMLGGILGEMQIDGVHQRR